MLSGSMSANSDASFTKRIKPKKGGIGGAWSSVSFEAPTIDANYEMSSLRSRRRSQEAAARGGGGGDALSLNSSCGSTVGEGLPPRAAGKRQHASGFVDDADDDETGVPAPARAEEAAKSPGALSHHSKGSSGGNARTPNKHSGHSRSSSAAGVAITVTPGSALFGRPDDAESDDEPETDSNCSDAGLVSPSKPRGQPRHSAMQFAWVADPLSQPPLMSPVGNGSLTAAATPPRRKVSGDAQEQSGSADGTPVMAGGESSALRMAALVAQASFIQQQQAQTEHGGGDDDDDAAGMMLDIEEVDDSGM
jgi:hypothetical protein